MNPFCKRVKPYLQLEHSDCGLTCIRMIARFYGKKYSMKRLHSLCDSSRLGISIKDICTTLQKIGFKTYTVKVGMDKVSKIPGPCILFWKNNHFVVFEKCKHNKFKIIDPALGSINLSIKDFEDHFINDANKGIVILIEENQESANPSIYDESYGQLNIFFKWTKQSLKRNKHKFSISFVILCISIIADILLPFLMTRTIDDGINKKDIPFICLMVIYQIMVFLGSFISNGIVNILMTKVSLNYGFQLMQEYLNKLIALPLSFYQRHVRFDIINKTHDQDRIKGFLTDVPLSICSSVILIIIFSILLLHFNVKIFLIYISFTIFSFFWNKKFLQRRKELDYATYSKAGENENILFELVNGIVEIKMYNADNVRIKKWEKNQHKINNATLKSTFNNLYLQFGNDLATRLRDLIITGLCAILVVKNQMTLGVMITTGYLIGRLSSPISTLLSSMGKIQDAAVSHERINEIMTSQLESEDNKIIHIPEFRTIEFTDVCYKYPGSFSKLTINNSNFEIIRGNTIAITGKSGSGKTTLLKLIIGLINPCSGNIFIDNQDLCDIYSKRWLNLFGVVMQDCTIFSDTIEANIAIADLKPDKNKIKEALEIACLTEFVNSLPMGLKTKIGASGLELSGGEKQRLCIARAVYKDPEILIFDEATSSLDADTEAKIVNNIQRYKKKGQTLIISAHRLSTIQYADTILYIENGQILEQGNHEQLINKHGKYYNLVKKQVIIKA